MATLLPRLAMSDYKKFCMRLPPELITACKQTFPNMSMAAVTRAALIHFLKESREGQRALQEADDE